MKRLPAGTPVALAVSMLLLGMGGLSQPIHADPSKYPEFAQQSLPTNVTPVFISVDELAQEITAGTRPLIIDVRTAEEYREGHILGALSVPLGEFQAYVKSIPKDRPIILY